MSDRDEVLGVGKQCREAMVAGDVATVSKLCADDMVLIHSTARMDTKEGLLAAIESGRAEYLSIEVADETVRCFGHVALAGGVATMVVEVGGERRVLHNRFTITWHRAADGWRMVNWQSTSVPEQLSPLAAGMPKVSWRYR